MVRNRVRYDYADISAGVKLAKSAFLRIFFGKIAEQAAVPLQAPDEKSKSCLCQITQATARYFVH